MAWVSQRGHELFTADGQLEADVDDFASLLKLAKSMIDEGAAPTASESAEQLTLAPEHPEQRQRVEGASPPTQR